MLRLVGAEDARARSLWSWEVWWFCESTVPTAHGGRCRGAVCLWARTSFCCITIKVTLEHHGALFVNVHPSWRNGLIGHVLMAFLTATTRKLIRCLKRMEGACENIISSPKWQNLKFAEISVWRRVSDFKLMSRLVISSFCLVCRRVFCVAPLGAY